ncbi:MAG: acyltransferase family protein [Halobacteriota archaeon]
MQVSSRWLQGVQYFRAFAIISVVLYHALTISAVAYNSSWITIIVREFASYGVPLFIFISGVVLYNKYHNGFPLSAFYKKRISAVVPPYVVWSTIYFAYFFILAPLSAYLTRQPVVPWVSGSAVTLVEAYVTELTIGIFQLWFVIILLQLYLLYPLLERIYTRATEHTSPLYILSALLFVQIAYNCLGIVAPALHGTIRPGLISTFYSLQAAWYFNFLAYVFYFVFGFFVAQRYDAIKRTMSTVSLKSISLVVLVSTIFYSVVHEPGVMASLPHLVYRGLGWLSLIMEPFYCLALILLFLKISMSWGEPRGFFLSHLKKVSEDSFGIYLIHLVFLLVFGYVLLGLRLNAYPLLFYPIYFALTFMSSYAAVEVIYLLPLSNIIIGSQRKRRVDQAERAQSEGACPS